MAKEKRSPGNTPEKPASCPVDMQRLCSSEERCQLLFFSINDPAFVVLTNPDGSPEKFLDVNPAACRILGYTAEELLQLPPSSLNAPGCPPGFFGTHLEELNAGGHVTFETTHVTRSGERIPVEISASKSSLPRRPFIVAIARNVTFRKRAEEAHEMVRSSEELLRTVVRNLDGVVFCVDKKGVFVLSDGKSLAALGLLPGQVVGLSVFDVYRDYPEILEGMRSALSGKPSSFQALVQGVVFDTLLSPVHDAAGNVSGVVGIATDITQREQARAQLIHSSKLAAIGTLAAGVSHEIHAPLAIIKGFTSLIRQQLSQSGDHHELVRILDKQDQATDRMAAIVKSLRTFARAETAVIEKVDIHTVIRDTISLYDAIYAKAGLSITVDLRATKPLALGNCGKMEQVLLNLLSNAKDACEQVARAGLINIETWDEGDFVVLKISDNGTGISKQHLASIFDPFFTTKPPESGTGLGLSISQAIIHSFGGSIRVESEPGAGASFFVQFSGADRRPE